MVQYSHVPGGSQPRRRDVVLNTVSKLSLRKLHNRFPLKRFVATPVDKESICFSNLPLDIRLMIWRTCFEPRIVTIYTKEDNERDLYDDQRLMIASVHAKMPLTLSINKESRAETLFCYPDLIQNPKLFRDMIYFNPNIDSLGIQALHKRHWRGRDRPPSLKFMHRDSIWYRGYNDGMQTVCFHLALLAARSESACRMVRRVVLPRTQFGVWDHESACLHIGAMSLYRELKSIEMLKYGENRLMVVTPPQSGKWLMEESMWVKIKSHHESWWWYSGLWEDFRDGGWRIEQGPVMSAEELSRFHQ